MYKFLIALVPVLFMTACAGDPNVAKYSDPARHFTRTDAQADAREQFMVYDPIEGANRRVYKFNAKLDKYVLLPVVKGYNFVVPPYVDDRISGVFSNLGEFKNATNSVLQAKPLRAVNAVGRFAVNSTVGLLGMYDPASHIGMKQHREDFGQTLGVWGVDPGAYVMLPVLGPTNVRDTAGMVVDTLAFSLVLPDSIEDSTPYKVVQYGVKPINGRANTDFEYNATASPFEYEIVRYVTTETRRLAVEQ